MQNVLETRQTISTNLRNSWTVCGRVLKQNWKRWLESSRTAKQDMALKSESVESFQWRWDDEFEKQKERETEATDSIQKEKNNLKR